MSETRDETEPRHPIQVVSRHTGLSPDVIRVWERRYSAVEPTRTPTNRRVYSDDDIERLRLLRRAIRAGRRIGDVGSLDTAALRELVAEDEAAEAEVPGTAGTRLATSAAEVGSHLRHCLDRVERLDAPGLARALSEAAVALSVPVLLEGLLTSLLREIGERWHAGTMRVAHEHLASSVVRTFLGSLASDRSALSHGPALVSATPAGQTHEFGALIASVAAAADGWNATHLGADLPVEEIVSAATQLDARVVALSLVFPGDDPRLPAELRRLGRMLPAGTAMLVGGNAAPAYGEVLREIGARICPDLAALRSELLAARSPGGGSAR